MKDQNIKLTLILSLLICISACNSRGELFKGTPVAEGTLETEIISSSPATTSPIPTSTPLEPISFTREPVQVLDPIYWDVYHQAADLIKCQITYITQTSDGLMWFGCGSGISSFDGSSWKTFAIEEIFPVSRITAVDSDQKGNLWLSTEKDGLIRFYGGNWFQITVNDGLINNEVTAIATTIDGSLWVGTRGGISKYDGNHWTSFHPFELLKEYYITCIATTDNGTVWFGLENGLIIYFDGDEWFTKHIGKSDSSIVDIAGTSDSSMWIIKGKEIIHIMKEEINIYENEPFYHSPPMTITETRTGTVWIGTYSGYKIAFLEDNTWKTINGDDIQEYISPADQTLPFYVVFESFEDNEGALWFGTVEGVYKYTPQGR